MHSSASYGNDHYFVIQAVLFLHKPTVRYSLLVKEVASGNLLCFI